MSHIDVAIPTPLSQTFTYLADTDIPAGSRVLVPFGRRRVVGVSLGQAGEVTPGIELKSVESVIDETPVYSPVMLELARWISTYYMHPLGEVLRAMLPAAATQTVKESYQLTSAAYDRMSAALLDSDADLLTKVFGRRKSLNRETLRSKLCRLGGYAAAADAERYIRTLVRQGLLEKERNRSMRARAAAVIPAGPGELSETADKTGGESFRTLSADQQAVFDQVRDQGLAREGSHPVFLLHGVTGSGKTEVYLHLIRDMLERSPDAQVLVLVPEISLTPQMTMVFERRFPGQVAVVHSAMTDPDRWVQLNRIRSGEARVLIGPRSAVFGPFQKLKLIIVDEEHDPSYKQSSGLTYNGRDVAVLRGKFEQVPVLLGSATPCMESWHNAMTGRYILLTLKERITGRPLPEIEVLTRDGRSRKGSLIGRGQMHLPAEDDEGGTRDLPVEPAVIAALQENLAAGRQAMVIVNRRGYAYYLFSLDQKKAVQCPHCSISLTLHARSTVLRCHYCDYRTTVGKVVAENPDDSFVAVGYGSQKAEDCIQSILPGARVRRLDSDTVVNREYLPRTLAEFREGAVDVLVGTQILAKGHDFPNVTLIAILEVDQLLGLPDFRAGERTFQLIVQAAGRAGRADLPGKVMIQTVRGRHPVVTAAIAQDYQAFASHELQFRKTQGYPPFTRMIALEFTSEDKEALAKFCQRVDAWVDQMAGIRPDLLAEVTVLGPAAPPIETIRSRHRRTLLFTSARHDPLRTLVGQFLQVFKKLPGDLRLKVDVDPQSLI